MIGDNTMLETLTHFKEFLIIGYNNLYLIATGYVLLSICNSIYLYKTDNNKTNN
jgi:hypothetical protein